METIKTRITIEHEGKMPIPIDIDDGLGWLQKYIKALYERSTVSGRVIEINTRIVNDENAHL